MKKQSLASILSIVFMQVLFNAIFGSLIFSFVGLSPIYGALTFNAIGIGLNIARLVFTGALIGTGQLHADLLKEVWIAQLMEKFYDQAGHMAMCTDMSQFVEANTINLADAGADPTVLIDNNTYPIPTNERSDTPLALPLSRFRTENTVIRDAEAVQLSYNKMESVIKGHRNALIETCAAKATHAWSPSSNTTDTPVLETTGSASFIDSGFKAITLADIAAAKRRFDLIKVPQMGRVLVLHPTHQAELLKEDTALTKAFADLKAGQVLDLFGFKVFVSVLTATYNKSTKVKVAYGAAAAPSTDTISSLFYHEAEVMKADGSVNMFARLRDPEADGDIIGFSKRFIGLPIRNKAQGAIVSVAS